MVNVVISGTGLYHPEDVITNDELVESFNAYVEKFNLDNEEKIASGELEPLSPSSADFIKKASAIERRYARCKKDILNLDKMWPYITEREDNEICLQAEAGIAAAKQALKNANKNAEDVDAVIVSCTHKQRDYPSIAIEIQDALGIKGFAYDMGVACSSATFALQTAADTIKAGTAKVVLVVIPEISLGQVNYRSRDSHFIFGEADTAVVVELEETCRSNNAFEILDTKCITEYSNNIRNNRGAYDRCAPDRMYAADKLFFQDGRKVFKEVTPKVIELIKQRLQACELEANEINRYWLHQANGNMNRFICEKLLGKDYPKEKAPIVLDEFANTGASGSIVAFHCYNADLQAGEYGVLCSFGAGYSIGCLLLRKK